MSRMIRTLAVTAAAGAVVAGAAGTAAADSEATGAAVRSPGAISGNVLQAPIHIPVNLCGNSVDGGGLLNAAFGNTCINASGEEHKVEKKKHDHKKHDHKKHSKKKHH
ncbi:chaplin [Streptomyces sp. NPDC048639]|uniref:chaplin n=1 Tax=Streptomyces sp. NPDC048639 TaxID=3365581 RepID=UPI003713208C